MRNFFSAITLPPSLDHLRVIFYHTGSALAELCLRPTWGCYIIATSFGYTLPPVNVRLYTEGVLFLRSIWGFLLLQSHHTPDLNVGRYRGRCSTFHSTWGIGFTESPYSGFYVWPYQGGTSRPPTWGFFGGFFLHYLPVNVGHRFVATYYCTELLPSFNMGPDSIIRVLSIHIQRGALRPLIASVGGFSVPPVTMTWGLTKEELRRPESPFA